MAIEGKADTLTVEQIEIFEEYLQDCPHYIRDRAIFLLGLKAGLRIGTIAQLEWSDLYTPSGEIKQVSNLNSAKVKGNRVYRAYFSNPALQQALRVHYKTNKCESETVFVSQKGTAFTPNTLSRLMFNHFKRSGLEGYFTSHSLRRTYASTLARANVDIFAIQKLMNHSDIKTTAGYVYTDDAMLSNAVCGI